MSPSDQNAIIGPNAAYKNPVAMGLVASAKLPNALLIHMFLP